MTVYGREEIQRVKTFRATWAPGGGLIRVGLVTDAHGGRAFFCTDAEASAETILETGADRGASEQVFHDVKEVHGAGEQQLRHCRANGAAWSLCLWLLTRVEWGAWNQPYPTICDRSASPWDNRERRPSPADRLRALRREILRQEYSRAAARTRPPRKIHRFIEGLLTLAT